MFVPIVLVFYLGIRYLKTVLQKKLFLLFFLDKSVQTFLNKLFIKRNTKF